MYGSAESKPPAENEPLMTKKRASLRRRKLASKKQLTKGASNRKKKAIQKKPSGPVLTKIFIEEEPKHKLHDGEEDSHRHSYIYSMLNPRSNRTQAVIYKYFIATVILVDLLFFIISTEPHLTKKQIHFFKIAEGVTSTIFLIEYMLRLCVCTESRRYGRFGPVLGRLRYLVTPAALIDALATFPFFIERFTGWDLPTLTYLRVFRLLRIMKTQSYAKAFDAVNRVIYYNAEILYVALMVCIFLVLFTSVLMYYFRPKHPVDSQDFESIAATMYLSTLMLTGQGGPDGVLPWYTKGIVLMTGVFSVAMFAIPASMLTWGFEAEAARLAARARQRRKSREKGLSCDSSTSSSSSWEDDDDSSSLSTSDEEYQKIIAGDEDSSEDEDAKMKKLMEKFDEFDTDKSGGLTLSEFMKLGMDPPSPEAMRGNIHNRFGAGARVRRGSDDSNLANRMDFLEKKVEANNEKLDQILALLKKKST